MNRGDIMFVSLPPPPGGTGREQVGQRPALIVHDDSTSSILPLLL
jgi:mRNA-degrading endonuclease toxin of MazEF toxin-antitoxin module